VLLSGEERELRINRKAFERLYADLARVYSEDARKNRSLSAVYEAAERIG